MDENLTLEERLEQLEKENAELVKQSRKWESRSKANAQKAAAYDELAGKTVSVEEQLAAAQKIAQDAEERAQAAENRLAEHEAQAQWMKDVAEVSEKYGLPASLLTERDTEKLEAQAQAIKAYAEGQPTSQVFVQDGKRPRQKSTPEQAFGEWLKNQT